MTTHALKTKVGLLMVNLGTPSEASPKAIKSYLSEFLRDRHVVDLNPLFWLPILYGIVIPKRLKYITQHYQDIWLNNQSPLLYYNQCLFNALQSKYPELQCRFAMTYGEPSIESALIQLKECETIHVLPLFPQYSTTTTLAIIDKIESLTQHWEDSPAFNYLNDYADHPDYVSALVHQIDKHIASNQPDVLLLSYHGIPISYIKKRHDQYQQRCELTTTLIKQKLANDYPNIDVKMVYQSKFGKAKWTEPNLKDVLIELAQKEKSVAVICPGFAVDCIETLHEINIENRELFILSGGKNFQYIPALNDSKWHIDLQSKLIDELMVNHL